MISIIAAIGKNNELGKKNALLWNLPADMKRFRETTKSHTVVMGEKTFRSIGKPLPNRRNIVLTQDKTLKIGGVETVYSIEELNDLIKKTHKKEDEVFIIGGGMIYKLFIEKADKLYITHVSASFPDADTFFPEIIPIVWNETMHKEYKKGSENPFDYTFSEYERF